ncbi:MAG: serine/threonine protein kinase, partial [Candidatus Hydrogenedentes bacterium]|nr:serine/threonine protein kinase [Candidatus Hydrogenedentota bacterium]
MVSLWHGHEFEGDELETWSQEIAAAALDVLPDQRTAFVEAGCAGSEPLLHRVNGLLENSFQERSEPPIDSACRPGEILSGCFLLGNLGRGGTADVYKAIQLPLKRIVAVKVLRDVGLIESSNLAREATRLSSLHHDNIVTVYNADFGCEKPCMVMEFVDGITLREWIRRQHEDLQCPPSGVIKSIVVQVLAGLGAAHRQGLVHRDIKPENILLSAKADGQRFHVKVTDFGLARRLDAAGKGVGGTAGYIAPEQFFGASPDARSDLFSVGVVLYEMLTGVHPFVGKSDAETWYNTIHTDPCFPPEGAFDRYREILQKALSKTPEERYDSTEEMVRALGEGAPEPLELNPLLSEFPDAIRRWADQAGAGFWMAVGSFTWGAVSLVLSVLCNAACLRVLWAAESGRGLAETIYGYAVEFNAGPWYLAGASACALAGIGFLQAAHRGLAATLKVTDGFSSTDPQPLSRVAEKNRRWFRILTPFALFAAACLVLIPEMGMREKNAFGWVQADMAETYLNVDYDQLRSDKKVGDLHSVRALCPICPVRVTHVSNRFSGYRQPSKVLFGVFLAFALAHQVILSAFVNFLAFKVVFFF